MTKLFTGRHDAAPPLKCRPLYPALLAAGLLLALSVPASAQISVGIRLPSVRIGINIPLYPQLVAVPGYPVYYAPDLDSNLFFYDGVYWVYTQDGWYASSWYDGTWDLIEPEYVPYFLLRVPVRYYRRPPRYFRGWAPNGPPRWGDYWGNSWAQRHRDWDRWDRASRYTLAPLPSYQRSYSRDRYPSYEQQRQLHQQNYNYQPREPAVRQHFEQQPARTRPEQPRAPRMETAPRNAEPSHQPSGDRAAGPRGNPNTGNDRRQQQAAPSSQRAPERQSPPAHTQGPRTSEPRRQPQSGEPQQPSQQQSQQQHGKPAKSDKNDNDKDDKADGNDKPKDHGR